MGVAMIVGWPVSSGQLEKRSAGEGVGSGVFSSCMSRPMYRLFLDSVFVPVFAEIFYVRCKRPVL
jgi:hypothetical protein